MSTSLDTLPSDCISILAEWLDLDGFISLMCTGSRVLRHKLRNVCELCFEAPNATKMPFPVLLFPRLRSLSIYGLQEDANFLDFRDGGELMLAQGSKTLEKLVLAFSNAFALFWSPYAELPKIPIRSRFPALSTLILRNSSCQDYLDSLFGELPETLTTFELSCDKTSSMAAIYLSSLAKLPRYLTSLRILSSEIDPKEEAAGFDASQVLPPNLRILELEALVWPTLMDYFPSTLTDLSFWFNYSRPFVWPSSKIPPGLIRLSIVPGEWTIEWDKPLPPTLEYFNFSIDERFYQGLEISSLPPKLKTIPEAMLYKAHRAGDLDSFITYLNSVLPKFPNLKEMIIGGKDNLRKLPGCLERLEILGGPEIDFPLPSRLSALSILAPLRRNDIAKIPDTLTSLSLARSTDTGLRGFQYDSQTMELFPPWKDQDLAQLERLTLLSSLTICWKYIDGETSLTPLAKLKNLKTLRLISVTPAALQRMPHCLPRSLTEINFEITSQTNVQRLPLPYVVDQISDEWLSACDLANSVPDLKTLKLEGDITIAISWSSSLTTLPRGLRVLDIRFERSFLDPGALTKLPSSLTSLRFLSNQLLSTILANEHFAELPKSLASLSLGTGQTAIHAHLFDLLPPNLANLDLDIEVRTEFIRKRNEFFSRNTLWEPFIEPIDAWTESESEYGSGYGSGFGSEYGSDFGYDS